MLRRLTRPLRTGLSTVWLFLPPAITAQGPDMEGIHLGMPVKEAMAALRAHNANLHLLPESATYQGLPSPLTYGISAVGGGEGFYFVVTMPPNPLVVSRVTWVRHFAQDVIPTQDAVVAGLAQKYGPISWDTTSAALSLGSRDVFWIDDERNQRIKGQPSPRPEHVLHERGETRESQAVGPGQRTPASTRGPPPH